MTRSRRQHWVLRHRITGEIKKVPSFNCEDGMWRIVLAGEDDFLADYEEEGSPLGQKLKKPRKAKEKQKAAPPADSKKGS